MLENFIQYLQIEKRFSEHTIIAYRNDLQQFSIFIEEQSISLIQVNSKAIRKYLMHMIEGGVSKKTVARKLSTLRSFYKWMQSVGTVEISPMQKINAPKIEKRLPEFAKEKELDSSLVQLAFSNDFIGLRDQLIFEMFYQTGMRLSELIGLKDIDVRQENIKVLGKRNKERLVPISSELNDLIQDYRFQKNKLNQGSQFFFIRENGDKLYSKLVYRKINYYLSTMTNLEKCSPHVLRHTFATHMLNNGAGLETLKDLLGHASLSATQVYTHNSFAKLITVYSQAHPRGHKK